MKKLLYLLILPVLMLACEKYPMPGSETLESFSYIIFGNNQSAESGEYLETEIGVQVMIESLIPSSNQKFHIELEVLEGGGILDKTTIEADSNGKMLTRWKLGNEENQQTVKGTIYDADGRYYSEFTINTNAFFPDKWNIITKGFLVGIQDMLRDTVNQRSMLLSGREIYISKNKFYDWQRINFSYNIILKELEINSKGEVFGGGWDGNLYKTTDWGQNWILVSKPITGNNYHFELSVSKDDYIWVSRWDNDMHCSIDGGISWRKDTTSIPNNVPLGPVYLFNNTSHLALALNLKQTFDDGITWKDLNNPKYPSTLFVTGKNEIILQGQEGGFTLYKSTDTGKTYKKVFSPNVAYGSTSWHCYDKFKNYYYVLAPGGGVWKTKDFEKFEELITFSLQRNLFIDHRGTIYASGFNYSNATPDPTLVLPGSEQ
ncbi:MAG: sialidase family protein [Draconibacterium sp.]|nr:sialidase family protein [Draconibacterium sp.]